MADKPPTEQDVLSSLPRSRPTRRSSKRDGVSRSTATAAAAEATEAAAKPAGKPRPAAKKTAAKKPAAKKPAAKKPAAKKPPAARVGAHATTASARSRPEAAAGAPRVPPAGYAASTPDRDAHDASGSVVGTAVQAAGELAQIGITVSRQALKSALGKLPRP